MSASPFYTLTYFPGCNKNICHIKIISEGTKEEIEEKMKILSPHSSQICDPFCQLEECENCIDQGCNENCGCFSDLSYSCYGFDQANRKEIHKQIKQNMRDFKDFVYECACIPDHFRINAWNKKEDFNKKSFVKLLQDKVF